MRSSKQRLAGSLAGAALAIAGLSGLAAAPALAADKVTVGTPEATAHPSKMDPSK